MLHKCKWGLMPPFVFYVFLSLKDSRHGDRLLQQQVHGLIRVIIVTEERRCPSNRSGNPGFCHWWCPDYLFACLSLAGRQFCQQRNHGALGSHCCSTFGGNFISVGCSQYQNVAGLFDIRCSYRDLQASLLKVLLDLCRNSLTLLVSRNSSVEQNNGQ